MRAFCSRYTFHFNALRNYLRKLERRPKWQHIRFTYDILSFLWSVQPLRVTPAYTGEKHNYPVFSCGTTRHPCVYRGKALRKSTALVFAAPTAEDHPRACGEKRQARRRRTAILGSPPRMRGKALPAFRCLLCLGITPAHAGKRYKDGRVFQLG